MVEPMPGICPKCGSRQVAMSTDYGPEGLGTGPGGRCRLGDFPNWPQPSDCNACGHHWTTTPRPKESKRYDHR